jgi:hypothetical protein
MKDKSMNENAELIQQLLPALVPIIGFCTYMLVTWIRDRSEED